MPFAVNTVRGGCMFTRDDRNVYGEGVSRSSLEDVSKMKVLEIVTAGAWIL